MWKFILRNRSMRGYQFRKERPILNYIADFMCLRLKLLIEVDGITHLNEERQRKDKIRDQTLKDLGYTTLRFTSGEVLYETDKVRKQIEAWIDQNAKVPPPKARPKNRSRANRTRKTTKPKK